MKKWQEYLKADPTDWLLDDGNPSVRSGPQTVASGHRPSSRLALVLILVGDAVQDGSEAWTQRGGLSRNLTRGEEHEREQNPKLPLPHRSAPALVPSSLIRDQGGGT